MKKNEVIWINSGWQPVLIGFCPTKKAWKRFCKDHHDGKLDYYSELGGAMTHMDNEDGHRICIVTMNLPENAGKNDAHSYLLHEAVHVFQRVMEHMGETNPGREIEAYSIQYITYELWKAYDSWKEKYGGN